MSDSDHNNHAQSEHAYKPRIQHERRADKSVGTMVTNQPARSEIADFGSVKRIVGPPGWIKADEPPGGIGNRRSEMFHPPEAVDININVFYRGIAVDDKSRDYFNQLLSRSLRAGETVPLATNEIKSLMVVLGISTIGDNQYTNPAAKGTYQYPAFHLGSAELVSLNGRTVLKAAGNFQNDQAIPGTEYQGFFFPSKRAPTQVEEIFYQAPTRGKFLRCLGQFEQALKTVEWH